MTSKDGRSARVEYESAFALGPLVGVDDPDAVLDACARCDELGLDTISAGGTIAWAMEAGVAGLAAVRRCGGAAARDRADRRARRDRRPARRGLAPRLGAARPRPTLAMHVKGLELPGYEPRTLHAMALGLAVNARGADHNRSGAYEADLSGELDRLDGGAAHVARGDRDRGPRGGDGLADLLQVPARRLRRAVGRVGRAARVGDRLGPRRRRAARHGARHRRRQARVQPPRGLDARGGHAAGAAARRAAHAPLGTRGDPDAASAPATRWSTRTTATRGLDIFVQDGNPAELPWP